MFSAKSKEPPKRTSPIPDRPKVFFDIAIEGMENKLHLEFNLFYKELPKTCLNFLYLCTGESGSTVDGKYPLHYKNSFLHRIIPEFMAQGGDFTNFNGTGGESIYGKKFNDENFKFKHDRGGLLSMANAGANTNGSQFFITFVPCPWLDGKHVVFGELTDIGMDQLTFLEKIGSQSGNPSKKATIVNCGEI